MENHLGECYTSAGPYKWAPPILASKLVSGIVWLISAIGIDIISFRNGAKTNGSRIYIVTPILKGRGAMITHVIGKKDPFIIWLWDAITQLD